MSGGGQGGGSVTSPPAVLQVYSIQRFVHRDGTPIARNNYVYVRRLLPDRGNLHRVTIGIDGAATAVEPLEGDDWGDSVGTEVSAGQGMTYAAVYTPIAEAANFPMVQLEQALGQDRNHVQPAARDVRAHRFVVPGHAGPDEAHIGYPTDGSSYVFSEASPGVLEIDCAAVGAQNRGLPDAMENRIRWTIASHGGSGAAFMEESRIEWRSEDGSAEQSWPDDPERGRGRRCKLRVTGLPRQNAFFGSKRLIMEVPDLGIRRVLHVKVFYPRDATNNPGGRDPNWFHYWNQTRIGSPHAEVTDELGNTVAGATPAMTEWVNGGWRNKQRIQVHRGLTRTQGYRAYSAGETLSGIALFAVTIKHEGRHVWQIGVCDAQVPTQARNGGWSFNVSSFHDRWNHSDYSVSPSRDLDRDRDDWPDAQLAQLHAGGAWQTTSKLEQDACNHAADIRQDTYNSLDWGSPGAQYT